MKVGNKQMVRQIAHSRVSRRKSAVSGSRSAAARRSARSPKKLPSGKAC